jgi:tetratricopeptide (TPR) repeat protein
VWRGWWWFGALLFAVVLAVFLPTLRNGFINLDDGSYVTANPQVRAGATLDGAAWAFRTFESANWHPVTWLSHMLDAELFGDRAWGHHLTSVVLHALNAALVFALLHVLTGSLWRSLLVAALFGLHPLRVESVAWVAERKDVLSLFFGLLSLLAYAAWKRPAAAGRVQPRGWYGILSLGFFALGLMSKPTLVTLPCVLLLLDFWPLRRMEGTSASVVWSLVREKIPFFVLTAASCVTTWAAQASVEALGNTASYPIASRLATALESYAGYLGKTSYPADLAIIYPFRVAHSAGNVALAVALLVAISVMVFATRRNRPWLATGWLWFLGTLVPMIGLVQVGSQAMADRYTYLPSIGLLVALVWGASEFVAGSQRRARFAIGLTLVVLAVFAVATVRQIGRWKDSETVFRHALAVTNDNYLAHRCLALALAQSPGRHPEAVEQFRAEVRVVPRLPEAHFELATALAEDPATLDEAIAEYRTSVTLAPRHVLARYGLGRALLRSAAGYPEALEQLRRTLELAPDNIDVRHDLAEALALTPEGAPEALAEFRALLRLRPERVEVRNSVGLLLARQGRLPEAVEEYEALLRAKPDFAPAHNNLANALSRMPGRRADAIAQYRAALALEPDYWEAHFNLGLALAAEPAGSAEAIRQFETVLRLQPGCVPARQMLEQLTAE